ncbi:MAG: SGNH/GDSL hydrolase family protein [Abditibacteriota bacterium]|nr:SGNH/GDSL hydrolase family protein [Abditibacteriota bacterium]
MKKGKTWLINAAKAVLTVAVMCFALQAFSADKTVFIKNLEKGKPMTMVAYGTSLTETGGWVNLLRMRLTDRYGDKVQVINGAKSAMWSGWGVENLDERVLAHKPDLVVLEFAVNDAFLEYETSVAKSRANMENMIGRIKKQNKKCEIIIMVTNPMMGVHLERRPDYLSYYEEFRKIAAENKFRLVDTFPVWKDVLDYDRKAYLALIPDMIHPQVPGSLLVTVPAVEAALYGTTYK